MSRSALGADSMRRRGPLLGLCLFLVVSTVLTWLVYVTLRRDVSGPVGSYSAVFTDVFGLREGDDVRVAGVRVGRVQAVELQGTLAKVSFVVQEGHRLTTATVASVNYQNIVGQRYLALDRGREGPASELPAGAVIGTDRTEPSFDIGTLLNGYEPLFTVLDSEQVNNLTNAVVGSLQGDSAAITLLVDQTSVLTETFVSQDRTLDRIIAGLDGVVGNLAGQNDHFERTLTAARNTMAAFDNRREPLVSSLGTMTAVAGNLSRIAQDVQPTIRGMLNREPGYTRHMLEIEPQIAYTGLNTPLLLKGLSRVFGEGAYMNAYACDVNAYGFFPGLNDVVPIIVDAATPGGTAKHTPKCRSMANG